MGQLRPISRCLLALLLTGSAFALLGAAARLVTLRGERWQAKPMRVAALTVTPRECLVPSANDNDALLVSIGRTAFNDPLLLGGQAARSQLSCATCHPSGRRNAGFLLQGLSNGPGTADVTSSIMSSHRGNGVFDPKPIPDLAKPKISRDPASPALATFVHGLITKEFDGTEPPTTVFEGLLAYIRAVRTCQPDAVETITVDAAIADIETAMRNANGALRLSDWPSTRLLIGAARLRLGDIYERYAISSLQADQAAIQAADRPLLELQHALDRREDIVLRLAAWRFSARLRQRLLRDSPRSFYDPATLAARIED